MSGPPSIRGFMSKMTLDAARALPAHRQRRVLADLSAETLALIDSTPRLGWVPMDENLKVWDAVNRVLGTPSYRHFFSAAADQIMTYPLLRTFFDGAVRLFGMTPQAMLKWSTYAWEQAVRDCGRVTYLLVHEAAERGQVEMALEDAHPLLLRGNTFSESLAGTFEMFLRRVSKKGRVSLRPLEPRASRLVYDVSWE